MTLTFIFSLMISLFMILSTHPLMILLAILTQTLMICIILWILNKTSWFSFILFLIFLGGLMVLFIYIVSLASNEKFEINVEKMKNFFMTLIFLILTFMILFFFSKSVTEGETTFFEQMVMIFSENILTMTMIMMSYLLFTLIVAVKITSKFEGPLRSTS